MHVYVLCRVGDVETAGVETEFDGFEQVRLHGPVVFVVHPGSYVEVDARISQLG